jgi:hypothetical protein
VTVPGTYRNQNGSGTRVFVGVLSNELARFSGFFQSLLGTMGCLPPGSGLGWAKGVNIPKACNSLAMQMLAGSYSHLWIMGDDHSFEPDIVARLLAHEVDIVVPHCLKRYPPWEPVLYDRADDLYFHPQLPESGLTEVHAAGSAGMLITRRALEAVEPPWFEGRNEDIGWCEKARAAGFTVWCDPEIPLGHITLATVRPTWSDGQWHPEMVHDGNVQVRYNRSNLPAAEPVEA